MRKSFVALALLVGAATMLTTLAYAQDQDFLMEKHKELKSRGPTAPSVSGVVTKASRLGATLADADTFFIGHVSTGGSEPWHIGRGVYKPGAAGGYEGMWDFDKTNTTGGVTDADTMQGWVPFRAPYTWANAIEPDYVRPWYAVDIGNRINAPPIQGRTPGIVSAWHQDNGVYTPRAGELMNNSWGGSGSAWPTQAAWCGLRAGDDNSVVDAVAYGGTGNAINGNTLFGRNGPTTTPFTQRNFPGYANCWDQMLYRDVQVAEGADLTVSFKYETQMDTRNNTSQYTRAGWFDLDPLSMATNNFISTEDQAGAGPVDSFMVYVGVPTDPTACTYSSGAVNPVFDLKRRWFSEVIAIDKPYHQIMTTLGRDSVYRSTAKSVSLANTVIQPMLDARGVGGGGVIRVVFRVKTNQSFSDEQNTGGSFVSTNQGAAIIDDVVIGALTTDFDHAGEINNTVEANGAALLAWHATGKSPKLMAHTHPIQGGIGYSALEFIDVCGSWDSPLRGCNINSTVFAMGDHDLLEMSAGVDGDREYWGGFLSPSIRMSTDAPTGENQWGIDRVHVQNNAPWIFRSDQYVGLYADAYTMCNYQSFSVMSYPALQKNGAEVWGDITGSGYWWWGFSACFPYDEDIEPLVYTTRAGGYPDSIKIVAIRTSFFTDFGMPPATDDGHYTDNVTLALCPPVVGTSDAIRSSSLWSWFGDAFPFNETEAAGSAAFDTTTAYIKTSSNVAANTGDDLRSVIPSDSTVLIGYPGDLDPRRVECVFRIFPGPGNYVTPGNVTSGVRRVQAATSPVAATSGDGSFWGAYMQTPGAYSKGTHSSGWNVNTWNSVRCDTAERNLFPSLAHTALPTGLDGIVINRWAAMIHEADPKFATLGILKNRCFLTDNTPGTPVDDRNIVCVPYASAPAWVSNGTSGFDATNEANGTREYTKVFPDGLLTPGSHVQYFFRQSKTSAEGLGAAGVFQMVPDTNRIYPNYNTASTNASDASRWAEISILPDRWKSTNYGGIGEACMLVLDYADNRGNEWAWVGMADSIGLTKDAKWGANNGWHQVGCYVGGTYGLRDYAFEPMAGADARIAVWNHGGQAGTIWDIMNVRGIEDPTGPTGSLGSRIAQAGVDKEAGKESKAGPTPDMLRRFYCLLFIMTGDMATGIIGPFENVGSNDLTMLGPEFLDKPLQGGDGGILHNRGLWIMGDGFVEGHRDKTLAHNGFLSDKLGIDVSTGSVSGQSYYDLCQCTVLYPDMIPTSAISVVAGTTYAVQNSCYWTNDVLAANAAVGAVTSAEYEAIGPNAPMYSGVYTAPSALHNGWTLVDGWEIEHLFGQDGVGTASRGTYFADVLVKLFAGLCVFDVAPWEPPSWLGVDGSAYINFIGNVGNNPVVAGGRAQVHFGLAKAERVEVKVYDVTGRLVRTLADRTFQAGPQKLEWDGTNGQGQVVSRGVYFTQVKFATSGLVGAKKVTVLK